MKTATAWRSGSASDTGLERSVNEDRILVDDARGMFLVVDGLGGHAAGELAAETAMQVIKEELAADGENVEERIRLAITAANNRIYELAQSNEDWRGMACVLTLAVADGERVTVGHVGDSRLYLIWNGKLRKLTSDHSPVGEREELGELSEEQAMQHPRRNEVFRDVGSFPRGAHDAQFIETRSFLFRPDAALLLCSDGLSDFVSSAQISEIVESYDGDANRVAQLLVETANLAGGRDNVSVVFAAGPEFIGSESNSLLEIRSRHATTRLRGGPGKGGILKSVLLLLAGIALGMILGVALWRTLDRVIERPAPPKEETAARHSPRDIEVNASDSLGIAEALSTATAGDTIHVPPGEYLGPLQLKNRVTVIATVAHQTILRSDPASTIDPGIAVVARGVAEARLEGLRIAGDETHPLRIGVLIVNSSVEIDDVEISGAIDAGLRVEGDSRPLLLGNFVRANSGAGVVIVSPSTPRLVGNRISENGAKPEFPAALDQEIRAKNMIEMPKTAPGGKARAAK